jgi:hypothetical protein
LVRRAHETIRWIFVFNTINSSPILHSSGIAGNGKFY